MASIIVLGVKVPFTAGGQDVLVRTLVSELKERGHRVDTVELPLTVSPKESLLEQIALWRSLKLEEFGGVPVDLVIATKFPSYFVSHPKKSVWLVHQHRAIYDLFGTRYCDFSDDPRDEALRQMLMDADGKAFSECQAIGAISKNVATRLKQFNGFDAEVLYPPLSEGGRYYNKPAEDYILSVGRICSIKRVDLIVKALPMIHEFVKLKIVGTADESGMMAYLGNEISKHHLEHRIEFVGSVSNEELLDLYARSTAVYYAPHNEDYGYVTLEAMASGKPVVTATDSGGVLEFIDDEREGLIAEPNSDAIAKAVNRLVEQKEFAEALGQNGYKKVHGLRLMNDGWEHVIEHLLSPLGEGSSFEESPKKVVGG